MGSCFQKSPSVVYLEVVLTGAAGSGKSTIAKQLKYINQGEDAFSESEVENFKRIIQYNLFKGLEYLMKYLDGLKEEGLTDKQNIKFKKKVLSDNWLKTQMNKEDDENPLTKEIANSIKEFYKDKGLKSSLKASIKEILNRDYTFDYCVANIDRFSEEEWTPTETDILRARQRTSGVVSTVFRSKPESGSATIEWTLKDLGGQATERKKWVHALNTCHACIFCAATDEFNIKAEENPKITTMNLSLELFGKLISDIDNPHKAVMLFLNKMDVLEKKYKKLKKSYPDFDGDSVDSALDFIRDLYMSKIPEDREVYVHRTCALDRDLTKTVFDQVMATIRKQRFQRLAGTPL